MTTPNKLTNNGFSKFNWIPACIIALLFPFVFWGGENVPSSTTDATSWLPDTALERQQYSKFIEGFGNDSFVLVSWPGCSLDGPELPQFATDIQNDDQGKQLIRVVTTGHQLIEQLTSKPLELPRAEAINRLEGILVGPDKQLTAGIIQLTKAGSVQQHAVIDLIYKVAQSSAGVSRDDVKLGGSVYEAVTFDVECEHSLKAFVVPAMLATLAIAWICLRQVELVLVVVVVGGFSRYMSLAFIYYTGGTLDPIMIVIPVLVMVLTVSGSIHVVNYFLDEERAEGVVGAGRRAIKAALAPCFLATISTAIGLASLGISDMQRIRNFGIYSTLNLLLSLLLILIVVPCTLDLLRLRRHRKKNSEQAPDANNSDDSGDLKSPADNSDEALEDFKHLPAVVTRSLAFVVAKKGRVKIICLAILVFAGFGLSKTTTTVKLEKNFRNDSEIIQNYRWIEENICPLISIETLIEFASDSRLSTVERLEIVSTIHNELNEIPGIGGVISAATFSPSLETEAGMSSMLQRRAINRRLGQNMQQLIDEGYVRLVDTDEKTADQKTTGNDDGENSDSDNNIGGQVWRITSRVPALDSDDYSTLIEQVDQKTTQVLSDDFPHAASQITVNQTGILPIIDFAQVQLLEDLVKSMALAILMICPVMIINLRSVTAGLLAMIPNILPIILIYGMLGWLGIEIDIGSILTGSIALGIAVDDTLHVLNWYKIGISKNMPTAEAIQFAYGRCAKAMFQTTLICGLGILVLTLSTFMPTVRFACLMSVMLWVALIGDMILLPALLAGPMGRAIAGKVHRPVHNTANTE